MTACRDPVIFRSVRPVLRFRVQNQGFLPYLTCCRTKRGLDLRYRTRNRTSTFNSLLVSPKIKELGVQLDASTIQPSFSPELAITKSAGRPVAPSRTHPC